jgi:hypothetical protein
LGVAHFPVKPAGDTSHNEPLCWVADGCWST